MPDLGILEILIAFFLFMPWTQAAVKEFRLVRGFVWFPPIALFCAATLFPAYGFRPECVPLLVFAFVNNILNLKDLKKKTLRPGYHKSPLDFLVALIFIALTTFVAVYFLPLTDAREWARAEETAIRDNRRNIDYRVRIYAAAAAVSNDDDAPLVIVVPPVTGSAAIVDRFCHTLSEQRGVTVASFSRLGLDIPAGGADGKKIYPSLAVFTQYALNHLPDWENKPDAGAFFEEERIADIRYILSAVRAPLLAAQHRGGGTYLLAYDEAASAAVRLARDETFLEENPRLKGIVAVSVPSRPDNTAIPLLSVDAGAFEYTDIPEKYPLVAALARILRNSSPPPATAPAHTIHTFIKTGTHQ
jgi:hypothetical protein